VNDAKARASGCSGSLTGSRGAGKVVDMKIALQEPCQPGINCLRSLSCGVRMKTTYCSIQQVTEKLGRAAHPLKRHPSSADLHCCIPLVRERAPSPVQADRTGAPRQARCWLDGVEQFGSRLWPQQHWIRLSARCESLSRRATNARGESPPGLQKGSARVRSRSAVRECSRPKAAFSAVAA